MTDFSIQHDINRVRQPTETSCWATAFAMQLGATRSRCYSVDSLIDRVESRGVTLQVDGRLPSSIAEVRRATRILGLDALSASGSVQIQHLVPHLERAPITLLGQFNYPGRRTPEEHAVVLGGMWGDGTLMGTAVSLVDPADTTLGFNSEGDFTCSWWDLASRVIAGIDYIVVMQHRGTQ